MCFLSLQNYRFLDLLHVLCVCDNVAIPNNQSYIVERWMQCEQVEPLFLPWTMLSHKVSLKEIT